MKKLLTIFFLSFSINGYCEWVMVASSDDQIVYLDMSTKKKIEGKIRVWTLYDLEKSISGVRSIVSLEEVDCLSLRDRSIQLTGYPDNMGKGIPKQKEEKIGAWRNIIPGSVASIVYKSVCN